MTIIVSVIIAFVMGYWIGDADNTKEITKHLKTKLHDLIDHNLALEKGYPFMKDVSRGKDPILVPKGKDLEKHVKGKYIQQDGKIIFSSGLLRDLLDEQKYVDKEWKRYGMEMYNDGFVKKIKLK